MNHDRRFIELETNRNSISCTKHIDSFAQEYRENKKYCDFESNALLN